MHKSEQQNVDALLSAAHRLFSEADLAARAVRADDGEAWAWHDPMAPGDELSDRELMATGLRQINYLDDQEPNDSWLVPGLAEVSRTSFELLVSLVGAKKLFKAACLPFADRVTRLNGQRVALAAAILRTHGLGRIHRQYAYRLPTLLKLPPRRVTFTWAPTRVVRRLDRNGVERHIRRHAPDERIGEYLDCFRQLGDECLAYQKPIDDTPHPRAWIAYADTDGAAAAGLVEQPTAKNRMVSTALPVFYLRPEGQPGPRFKPLPQARALTGIKGRPRKLESRPLFADLHLYRYLEEAA